MQLTGQIDPQVASAMSEEDFALVVAALKGETITPERAHNAGFDLTENNHLLGSRGHPTQIIRQIRSDRQVIEHSRTGAVIASGSPEEITRIIESAGGDINRVTRRHFIEDARNFKIRDWGREIQNRLNREDDE